MKRLCAIIALILIATLLFSCTYINENEAGEKIAAQVMPSVLELTCTFQASVSSATGFIVDERGYVLTNAHVVTNTVDRFVYEANDITGSFNRSSEKYKLDIVAYDIEKDLAVLKFRRNDLTLKVVTIGNSQLLTYGTTIFTLGNAEGYGIAMTKGIISVPIRKFKDNETQIVSEVVQFDAAVNNGSSGGPLINLNGEVVGIISFKIKQTDTRVEGIGFAIPSSIFMDYFHNAVGAALAAQQNEAEDA